MKLIESETYHNLARAFAGECQAHIRYMFIEYGAKQAGHKSLAAIIDKISYNEFNHARMFYTFLSQASNDTIDNVDIMAGYPFREKWDVLENLKLAAEDENEEAEVVYPAFRDKAKEEGFDEIAKLFDDIIKVEKGHRETFLELYDQMKNGSLYKKDKPVVWRCADCGYESTSKEAWDECPVCKAKQGAVVLHLKSTQQN